MAEEDRPLKFSELSKEAQEKAIKEFRNKYYDRLFDEFDSDSLREQMEQDLYEHYGLGDEKNFKFEVAFSLSYSQGDGVCFKGQVDVENFIKKEKVVKEFGILIPLITARVVQNRSSHYCHYNTMDVEVEIVGQAEDLLSDDMHIRNTRWMDEFNRIDRENYDRKTRYENALRNPMYEYELLLEAWKKRKGTGVKAWTPELPPDPPDPGDLPKPPKYLPEPPIPAALRKAVGKADKDFALIESKLADEFREYLLQRIREISRELEKMGYSEIEYHQSDEYIRDLLVESPSYEDLEFDVDGYLV